MQASLTIPMNINPGIYCWFICIVYIHLFYLVETKNDLNLFLLPENVSIYFLLTTNKTFLTYTTQYVLNRVSHAYLPALALPLSILVYKLFIFANNFWTFEYFFQHHRRDINSWNARLVIIIGMLIVNVILWI